MVNWMWRVSIAFLVSSFDAHASARIGFSFIFRF
jgi:hypothetical protein